MHDVLIKLFIWEMSSCTEIVDLIFNIQHKTYKIIFETSVGIVKAILFTLLECKE
jgi:hypothetical protein